MTFHSRLGRILLLSTALGGIAGIGATAVRAQGAPTAPPVPTPPNGTVAAPPADTGSAATSAVTDAPVEEEEVDVSAPGGSSDEIVVVGRRIPNVIRSTREVVSVLSQGDIARTGEGDIAGALQRVTGLSVVGGRFVYVRGLGERYSLALLNGLPIPSPDPLRRVVPLDLFPTSVLASAVVQKSYSANFPGEFGGGVINLTTRAVPDKPFLTIGGSIGGNTATTGQLGYVYDGGSADWTGYDDGTRSVPGGIAQSQRDGQLLFVGPNYTLRQVQDITASLDNAPTSVIQRNEDLPANFAVDFSAGTAWEVGDGRIGIIASAGWRNNWQTKAGLQQSAVRADPGPNGPVLNPSSSFDFVSTENRIVVNGLLGVGFEFGEHKIRLTNVYVHDTLKEARIQAGVDLESTGSQLLNRSFTNWFERQLIDSQIVGEFKFDNLSVDIRGTYANSKRLAPYERAFSYAFDPNLANDFVNDLRSPGQSARVAFSRLNENLYGAGGDLGYKIEGGPFPIRLTAGYAYTDSQRISSRFDYRYQTNDVLPEAVAQLRPDFLLSDFNVYTYGIILNTQSTIAPVYEAGLTVHAGYGQFEIEPFDGVQFTAGVRYETAKEFVNPIDVFGVNSGQTGRTELNNDYFLPGGTLTWNFAEDMQLRLSASKTIARPQFRELAPQFYFDSDTDRDSVGNQFLIDSQLFNAEARYEYYFGRDQRLTVGAFYKTIKNPIETIAFQGAGGLSTTFANAPRARLYGAEFEVQKYVPLDGLGKGDFFASRRILISANYTYTDSRITVRDGDTTIFPAGLQPIVTPADVLFRDGQPLTGQSDHIVNLQFGLQDQDSLSEQTILLNYASDRATQRGPAGLPDLTERPGLRLDVVLRQGFAVGGMNLEAKFEARNLTNIRYQEFQRLNGSRIDNNSYVLGRTFALGVTANF